MSSELQLVEQDERLGLPSASYVERLMACPGSWLLCKHAGDPDRETKDAAAGTRIHEARHLQDVSGLDPKEAELVQQMADEEKRIYDQWISDNGIDPEDVQTFSERRIWWDGMFSAKLDFYAVSESSHVLILDRKSGRKGVTPPASNWQLRSSAVLVAQNHDVDEVRVAIVQPFAKRQPTCDYDTASLNLATEELYKLLGRIQSANAPRNPGHWCDFCNAKAVCPEAQGVQNQIVELKAMRWAALPIQKRVELWDKAKLAKKIAKQIEDNISAELKQDPKAYEGYFEKRPDTEERYINDTIKAHGVLQTAFPDVDPEELNQLFNQITSVTIGGIEKYVQEKRGWTTGETKAWVNETFGPVIGRSPKAGSVVRVKAEGKKV